MKLKKNKIILISIIIIFIIGLISYILINKSTKISQSKLAIESTSSKDLENLESDVDFLTSVTNSVIADANTDEVSYVYDNATFSGASYLSTYINLTNSHPYGKVYYYNSGEYDAKLYILGNGEIIDITIIPPNSGGSLVWEKSLFKSQYDIGLTATSGTLDGSLILASASDESYFDF